MTISNINFNNDLIRELSEKNKKSERTKEYIHTIWEKDFKDRNVDKKEFTANFLQYCPNFNTKEIKNTNYTEVSLQTPDRDFVLRYVKTKSGLYACTKESEIKGFNNYYEYDKNGNKINFIEYTKGKNKLKHEIKFSSENGSFHKIIISDGNQKYMTTKIINKNGNKKTIKRTYIREKSDDVATSTINGKEYKISGLNSDILIITDGKKEVKLDLNKLTEGQTAEGKKKLKEYIKNLSGDILINLSLEINKLNFSTFEGSRDGYFDNEDESIGLSLWNNEITTLHELGHSLDSHVGGDYSCQFGFENTYNNEKNNIPNIAFGNEIEHSAYFLVDRNNSGDPNRPKREIFAESYALINNMEISNINTQQFLLMRAFQQTMQYVDDITQIENLNKNIRKK